MDIVTILVVIGLCSIAWGLGALMGEAHERRRSLKVEGRAVGARIAVGRALPYLTQVEASQQRSEELAAALHILRALTWGSGRYWRHLVRGTHYEVLSYQLHLQASDVQLLHDDCELVLYIDTRTGRLSARHPVEFHDGRFVRVTRDEALDADEMALQAGPGYVDQDRDLIRRMDRGAGRP